MAGLGTDITLNSRITITKVGSQMSETIIAQQDLTGKYTERKLPTTVPTSAAAINFGEITGAPQLVIIKNLDSTNYIEVGGDSGLTVFKLKIMPGGKNEVSPSSGTVYWKANTAPVDVQLIAVEA